MNLKQKFAVLAAFAIGLSACDASLESNSKLHPRPDQSANAEPEVTNGTTADGRIVVVGRQITVDIDKLTIPDGATSLDVFLSSTKECTDSFGRIVTEKLSGKVILTAPDDQEYFICYVGRDSEGNVLGQSVEEQPVRPGGEDPGTQTPSGPELPDLQQPAGFVLEVGKAMTDFVFVNNGSAVASCEVTPALPSGIVLDAFAQSCRLRGTATEASSEMTYTVQATSASGAADVSINISVVEIPTGWTVRNANQSFFGSASAVSKVKTAIANNGHAIVSWQQADGIYFRRKSSSGWGNVSKLLTATQVSSVIDVKIASDGSIALLYGETGNLFLATYRNQSWSIPGAGQFFASGADESRAHLHLLEDGTAIVGYNLLSAGGSLVFVRERQANGVWTAARSVNDVPGVSISYINDMKVNANGDMVLGVYAFTSSAFVCLPTRRNGVWSIPAAIGDCFAAANGSVKVAINSAATPFATMYGGVSHYMIVWQENVSAWMLSSNWPLGTSITGVPYTDDTIIDDLQIFDDGDISVIWRVGSVSNYAMTAFHSRRVSGIWTHPNTVSQRIFDASPFNSDYEVKASIRSNKTGLYVAGWFSGTGIYHLIARPWDGSWPTFGAVSPNFRVDGGEIRKIAVASAGNGNAIVAWVQDAATTGSWVNVAEYNAN